MIYLLSHYFTFENVHWEAHARQTKSSYAQSKHRENFNLPRSFGSWSCGEKHATVWEDRPQGMVPQSPATNFIGDRGPTSLMVMPVIINRFR
jgi:hypothetical protein